MKYSCTLLGHPCFDKNHWHHPGDFEIAQAVLKKYDNKDWTIKYLYTLCSVAEAVKGLTSKYPIFVDSINQGHFEQAVLDLKEHYKVRDVPEELERCHSLVEGSRIEKIVAPTLFDLSKNFDKPYCVGNHFSEEVQKQFARRIYENLRLW